MTKSKIIIWILIGLSLRLALATVEGYSYDTSCWQSWAETGTIKGLTRVYEQQINPLASTPDYLPPYLTILTGLGHLQSWMAGGSAGLREASFVILLKMPGIIADLVLAILLFYFVQKKSPAWAKKIFLLAIFHPILLLISSVWGQIDSLPVIFLVLMLWALEKKNTPLGTFWFTIACLFKLQSIALFPLLAMAWWPQKSWKLLGQIITIVSSTVIALNLPFLISGQLPTLIYNTVSSVGRYPFVSMNAWNLWWLIPQHNTLDTATINGIQFLAIGFLLYILIVILLLKKAKPFNSWPRLWGTSALLSLAFFLFPTEMHERYFFPFIIFALPLISQNRAWFKLYFLLSVTLFLNLLWVLYYQNSPTIFTIPTSIIALLNLILFFWGWRTLNYFPLNGNLPNTALPQTSRDNS